MRMKAHREKAMKVKCLNCKTGIRIGSQSRFGWFSCPTCRCLMHGLECEVSLGSWILDDPFETGCPHCWQVIRLYADWQRGGFYGPARCCWCHKKLESGRHGRPEYSFSKRQALEREANLELEKEVAATRQTNKAGQQKVAAGEEWWQGMECPFCHSPMFPLSAAPDFPRCPLAPENQTYCK